MRAERPHGLLRSLRNVASFALLGAVTMGLLTGWGEHPPTDFRAWGAGALDFY